ncbi:MAG: hemerythrin domain-containing protein [Pseudomonadales bacterium]
MPSTATAHEQSTSAPHNSWASAADKTPNSASAARAAVMASLHGENSYLNTQLNTVQLQVDRWQPRRKPDYTLLYDTMRQLHDFPHDVVQPKEDLVYRRLMERDAEEAEEFAHIRDQHEQIHDMSSRLLHHLSDISHGVKTARRDRLRPQLQRFVDTFRQHIDVEENEIFPTAEKHLLDNDWYALQSGISYLESVHTDDKLRDTNARTQQPAVQAVSAPQSVAHYPQSVTRYVADQTERVTASFALAQLFSAYTLAESIGGISECVEELTELGAKQAKAGLNESLDEIMACRDTSGGVTSLPGKLLRTTLDNFGNTWSEAKQIVKKSWQQEQSLNSRVGLLQDIWRSDQPLRLRSH